LLKFDDVKKSAEIRTYIETADEMLALLGYTEHSFAHTTKVADTAAYILQTLGYPEREIERAKIAGFLHDVGNLVNRVNHAQSGALMAFVVLSRMGADPEDVAAITAAIGNHDEGAAIAISPVTAALILADKTDVRDSRVRNPEPISFDIHDRVNYAVKRSRLEINPEHTEIGLFLDIDSSICSVMDYFEIFIDRMILCRKAAEKLGLKFALGINGQRLL
jgi:metal-dependent HD superfamily phosphatase/phosphodiesterase